MKYTSLKTTAMLGLFIVLAVMTANAQTGSRIEASIPFDFAAGETNLKAGDYTVKRISKDALQLRNAQTKTSVIVMAPLVIQQTRNDAPERLVFKRYGNEYFLSQVWTNRAASLQRPRAGWQKKWTRRGNGRNQLRWSRARSSL